MMPEKKPRVKWDWGLEQELLRLHRDHVPASVIAVRLERTPDALAQKLSQLRKRGEAVRVEDVAPVPRQPNLDAHHVLSVCAAGGYPAWTEQRHAFPRAPTLRHPAIYPRRL